MLYSPELIPATLLRRYKRFLADVELANQEVITVHTPNTGSMAGCSEPGSRVWLRDAQNPKRKYRYSWEMTETPHNVLIGVNTGLAPALVKEAIINNTIEPLANYDEIKTEVPYGNENSRIDLLLRNASNKQCYVEVKNVTASYQQNIAAFPDAVTKRGTKHLRELQRMVIAGHRAVIFYCVQRNDVEEVRPAQDIDPEYAQVLREAVEHGVEALAYKAEISPQQVFLNTQIPVNV